MILKYLKFLKFWNYIKFQPSVTFGLQASKSTNYDKNQKIEKTCPTSEFSEDLKAYIKKYDIESYQELESQIYVHSKMYNSYVEEVQKNPQAFRNVQQAQSSSQPAQPAQSAQPAEPAQEILPPPKVNPTISVNTGLLPERPVETVTVSSHADLVEQELDLPFAEAVQETAVQSTQGANASEADINSLNSAAYAFNFQPPDMPNFKPTYKFGVQPFVSLQPLNLPISFVYSMEPCYPFKNTQHYMGLNFQLLGQNRTGSLHRALWKTKKSIQPHIQAHMSLDPRLDVSVSGESLFVRCQSPSYVLFGNEIEKKSVLDPKFAKFQKEAQQEKQFFQGVNPDYLSGSRATLGEPPSIFTINLVCITLLSSGVLFVFRSFFKKRKNISIPTKVLTYKNAQQIQQDCEILKKVYIQQIKKRYKYS